jgi:putative endonuclease
MTDDRSMTNTRMALGRRGEELAAVYLAELGYETVARNWRTRRGELDLVARDGEWLVFVEVRARRIERAASAPMLGRPEDSVTPRKQLQLVAMADAYLFQMPWDGPWRIDVIALEIRQDGSVARLNHVRDAVGGTA